MSNNDDDNNKNKVNTEDPFKKIEKARQRIQDVPSRVLEEDEGFKMRVTVEVPPEKDNKGRILDFEGKPNKPRVRVGLISNPYEIIRIYKENPNDERLVGIDINKVIKEAKSKVLTLEQLKYKRRMEKEDKQKQLEVKNELQKIYRFEMQGRLTEYKVPEKLADEPEIKTFFEEHNKKQEYLKQKNQERKELQAKQKQKQAELSTSTTTTTTTAVNNNKKGEGGNNK